MESEKITPDDLGFEWRPQVYNGEPALQLGQEV